MTAEHNSNLRDYMPRNQKHDFEKVPRFMNQMIGQIFSNIFLIRFLITNLGNCRKRYANMPNRWSQYTSDIRPP
jgi:hypothetical protein